MAIIHDSQKLSFDEDEKCICLDLYVFFRTIPSKDGIQFMTATANENTGKYKAFHKQDLLIEITKKILHDFEFQVIQKTDSSNRPYVETIVPLDKQERILHIADTILMNLGFKDLNIVALQAAKELYDELFVECGYEERAYLSDGCYVTKDLRYEWDK